MINPTGITYLSFDNAGNVQLCANDDSTAWVAHVSVNALGNDNTHSRKNQHKLQRQAVRELLQSLVKYIYPKLNPVIVSLDESNFPYVLKPMGYFVCFSHSKHHLACAVSKHSPIGIDIEVQPISYRLAQRFFHHDEKKWLSELDSHQQTLALNILWTLKEAHIKRSGSAHNTTLTAGLKRNFVSTAIQLLTQFKPWQYHLSLDNVSLSDQNSRLIHTDNSICILSTQICTNKSQSGDTPLYEEACATTHIALYLPTYKMAIIY